jgi:hypothetical protein
VTQTHTPTRRALLALAALATSALIAACGSSSSSSTSSSTAAASASSGSGTNRAALMACLRKHGITLPAGAGAPGGGAPGGGAPGGGALPSGGSGAPAGGSPPSGVPGGANGAKLQAAFKACGANFPARRNGAAVPRQTIQKYVTCVRQHGYKLPNPNFSGTGPVFPASIRSSAKFQSASRHCQNLLAPAGASARTGA